jgi:chromate transporter
MRVSGMPSGIVAAIRSGSFDMSERSVGLGEIARVFLKIGAMSYGGPAIMGIMQTEIQEKRQWVESRSLSKALRL